ncbi:MAG: MAPEG family protein [Pseudomonadota bacterium]|nr:MAPEG family protein [Pseudomonadota bacterium]
MIKPMLAMMGVTAGVWVCLYAKRLPYLLKHQVDPQSIRTPDLMQAAVPEQAQYPAYNLRNLFELPVLFYGLCLATMQLQAETPVLLSLAWLYVALRALHSIIHCSYNRVTHRFTAYLLSSIVLWIMLAVLAYQVF